MRKHNQLVLGKKHKLKFLKNPRINEEYPYMYIIYDESNKCVLEVEITHSMGTKQLRQILRNYERCKGV